MLQAEDDDHVPLDTRMQKALAGDLQQLLRRLIVQLKAKGKLEYGIARRTAPAAEKLVSIGLLDICPPDDPFRSFPLLPAQG